MRNFLNTNEIYPILDLIGRRNKGNGVTHNFDNSLLGGGESNTKYTREVKLTRDSNNSLKQEVVSEIYVAYTDGSVETIRLIRGATPPVPEDIEDYEYINNIMVVGVEIEQAEGEKVFTTNIKINKENGYGKVLSVEMSYSTDGQEDTEVIYNDYDYYNQPTESGYDTDVDDLIDYADVGYDEADSGITSDSWGDGFNPSKPVDVDV